MSEAKGRWRLTRRGFLIGAGAAGGALAVGLSWGVPEARLRLAQQLGGASIPGSLPTDPTLWFEIGPDERVRLFVPKVEMGQGIHTALAQIAADELALSWEQVEVVQASTRVGPLDESGTQGSASVRTVYAPLRQAAATLREMLRAEAARQLGQPADGLVARDGAFEGDGERRTYGEIVANVSEWGEPPDDVPLKAATEFRFVGQSVPRVDIPGKVTGAPGYGFDARAEGTRYGAVVKAPTLEATVRRVENADEVRGMPGVLAVVHDGDFVGVVADSRVAAWRARDALSVAWNEGRRWQQAELEEMVTVGGRGGVVVQRSGDAPAALNNGEVIRAEYRTPFAVHAPMEPQAALADVRADNVEVRVSTQMQAMAAERVAEALGRDAAEVEVTPTWLGGGFGRKGGWEVAIEAARLSQAVGAPVHVGWTREEEMRHSFYRPPTHHEFRATLGDDGRIAAVEHRQASGDVLFGFFPAFLTTIFGADFGAWRGATIFYDVPHRRTVAWRRKLPVPTGPWRGLGLLANGFAVESFIDELAHAAGADPLRFRLDHLPPGIEGDRWRRVLETAAEAANWGGTLPDGHALGVACVGDVGTVVAQVAEVSLEAGQPRVHRVVAAMDCGQVINPDGARAQVEGNVMWGVGSALIEQMQIKDGRVDLRNFDSYPLLRMDQAPHVEALLVPSPLDEPRGVGEPAIGPVAAAIGNALFALTGTRRRALPFV